MKFRRLNENEIDARINAVTEKGVTLLLYKDARVDQNILDETVGPLNWKRSHQLIGDRLYCTVEIWDKDKKQWISKQDVGTESYTEKEKGQASDSFKRACFNFGIGRELYTAPFIFVPVAKCSKHGKQQYQGKDKYTCYDKFYVSKIGYDDAGNINSLVVKNKDKGNMVVWNMGEPDQEPETRIPLIDTAKLNTLHLEMDRTGITLKTLSSIYGIKKLEEMTVDQYVNAMDNFKKTPDKPQPTPENIDTSVPDGIPDKLPFS